VFTVAIPLNYTSEFQNFLKLLNIAVATTFSVPKSWASKDRNLYLLGAVPEGFSFLIWYVSEVGECDDFGL